MNAWPVTADPLPILSSNRFGLVAVPGVVKFTVTLPVPVNTTLSVAPPMVTVPVPLPPIVKLLTTLKIAEPVPLDVVLVKVTGVLPFCTIP